MANILFITPSLGFGGAAKMLSFVAESLTARGYNVKIANLENTTAAIKYKRNVSDKIEVISLSGLGTKDQLLIAHCSR